MPLKFANGNKATPFLEEQLYRVRARCDGPFVLVEMVKRVDALDRLISRPQVNAVLVDRSLERCPNPPHQWQRIFP